MGDALQVIVTASNSTASASASSAPTSLVQALAPTNVSLPVVSGIARDGQTLSTTNGTWSAAPAATYTYQWQRCDASGSSCANIVGANGISYAISDSDIDHTIRAQITASNSQYVGGTETAVQSVPTAVVQATPPTNIGAPSISGTVAPGNTVTANVGSWTAAPTPTYTYQWQDCNT